METKTQTKSAEEKRAEVPAFLIKEMDATYKQLRLYQDNKDLRIVPRYLANKIAYLRAYSNAIKTLERLDKEGKLENLINRINIEFGFPRKR